MSVVLYRHDDLDRVSYTGEGDGGSTVTITLFKDAAFFLVYQGPWSAVQDGTFSSWQEYQAMLEADADIVDV